MPYLHTHQPTPHTPSHTHHTHTHTIYCRARMQLQGLTACNPLSLPCTAPRCAALHHCTALQRCTQHSNASWPPHSGERSAHRWHKPNERQHTLRFAYCGGTTVSIRTHRTGPDHLGLIGYTAAPLIDPSRIHCCAEPSRAELLRIAHNAAVHRLASRPHARLSALTCKALRCAALTACARVDAPHRTARLTYDFRRQPRFSLGTEKNGIHSFAQSR